MKRQIAVMRLAILLASTMVLLPGLAFGDVGAPVAGPTWGIDDMNTSTLGPYPLIPVSSIGGPNPGQCIWINSGMNSFVANNPVNGSGPSGQGWSYNWAGPAVEAQVEAGITVLDYKAWVVSAPTVTAGDDTGTLYPPGDYFQAGGPPDHSPTGNVNDVGGAIMSLKYTPGQGGAPVINNLHWVQAYNETVNGVGPSVKLDNPFAAGKAPYYDAGGAAGTLAAGGGWFLDIPYDIEKETFEGTPVSNVQFQVVLASVTQGPEINGIKQNVVTLYGGEWWGYQYDASDVRVPEPSTFVLLAFGAMGLFIVRRMRR